MFILNRYIFYYKKNGFIKTLLKVITSPLRLIKKKNYINKKKILFSLKPEERFNYIFNNNFWSSPESVSGVGSELNNTRNIRREIKKLIIDYNINNILDAPCGDFNWIKHILNENIDYIGGDIVKNLIEINNTKYKKQNIKFINLDIISNKLPDSDIMICRDCLIHFSFKNIEKFLNNFCNSRIKYILLTNYKLSNGEKIINHDIEDGDYRIIDLSNEPFNLPEPIKVFLDKDEEHRNSNLSCYLNLYSNEQIKKSLNNKNN